MPWLLILACAILADTAVTLALMAGAYRDPVEEER